MNGTAARLKAGSTDYREPGEESTPSYVAGPTRTPGATAVTVVVAVPLPVAPENRPDPPVTVYVAVALAVVALVKQPVPVWMAVSVSPFAAVKVVYSTKVAPVGLTKVLTVRDSFITRPSWVAVPVPVWVKHTAEAAVGESE